MQLTTNTDLTTLDMTGLNGKCPHCGIDHICNGAYEHDPANGYKCDEFIYCCMGCGGEWGPAVRGKRKGTTHAGKAGARNKISVKEWLKANRKATYAEALAYVTSTGRSEITLKIQMRNLGISLKA